MWKKKSIISNTLHYLSPKRTWGTASGSPATYEAQHNKCVLFHTILFGIVGLGTIYRLDDTLVSIYGPCHVKEILEVPLPRDSLQQRDPSILLV